MQKRTASKSARPGEDSQLRSRKPTGDTSASRKVVKTPLRVAVKVPGEAPSRLAEDGRQKYIATSARRKDKGPESPLKSLNRRIKEGALTERAFVSPPPAKAKLGTSRSKKATGAERQPTKEPVQLRPRPEMRIRTSDPIDESNEPGLGVSSDHLK